MLDGKRGTAAPSLNKLKKLAETMLWSIRNSYENTRHLKVRARAVSKVLTTKFQLKPVRAEQTSLVVSSLVNVVNNNGWSSAKRNRMQRTSVAVKKREDNRARD